MPAEVPGHVVAREPHSTELDPSPPSRFDVHDREEDRQAGPPREHPVEHRIVRIVVVLPVADEPVASTEDPDHRVQLGLRIPVARRSLRDLDAQTVELRECPVGIALAELPCHPKQQNVEPPLTADDQLGERSRSHPTIVARHRTSCLWLEFPRCQTPAF